MATQNNRDGYEMALEAKIALWQAALAAYRAAKSADGPLSQVKAGAATVATSPDRATPAGFDLPVGAFRTKSLPDAIKLYLAAGNRKQSNKEIAAGVKAGGLESNAANLEASVASVLHRLKTAGVVLRFDDGWDLAEHYPEHIRKKLEPNAKPAAKAKKKAKRAKPEPTTPSDAS